MRGWFLFLVLLVSCGPGRPATHSEATRVTEQAPPGSPHGTAGARRGEISQTQPKAATKCDKLKAQWRDQFGRSIPLEGGRRRTATAHYLNYIHRIIHPMLEPIINRFHDDSAEVYVVLGLAVDSKSGELSRVDVVCSSGKSDFDDAVTDTIRAASPLDVPDPEILSDNSTFIATWEVHTNPDYACSSYFSTPLRFETDGIE